MGCCYAIERASTYLPSATTTSTGGDERRRSRKLSTALASGTWLYARRRARRVDRSRVGGMIAVAGRGGGVGLAGTGRRCERLPWISAFLLSYCFTLPSPALFFSAPSLFPLPPCLRSLGTPSPLLSTLQAHPQAVFAGITLSLPHRAPHVPPPKSRSTTSTIHRQSSCGTMTSSWTKIGLVASALSARSPRFTDRPRCRLDTIAVSISQAHVASLPLVWARFAVQQMHPF